MKLRLKTHLFFIMFLLSGTVMAESTQQAEADKEQENNNTTNKVERFLWPFTQWFEETVQSTPLIRTPKNHLPAEKSSSPHVMNVRSAIEKATRIYPGTVLNAEKIEKEGAIHYQIRIISKQGVVKTISINAAESQTEENQNENFSD